MGWTRQGRKGAFRYVDQRGRRVDDPAKLERVEQLAIPPAWKDVWISPSPRAKLQATGYDKAGRKQYLYHPSYRAAQEQAKYDRLIQFAEKLPDLRTSMAEHLDKDALDRERVSAIALRLINLGWFRVGSERHAKESGTYGITTLTRRHVEVRGHRVRLAFRGKHAVQVRTELVDSELAAAIRELLALRGGARIFRYEWEGSVYNLTSKRLNDYVKLYLGADFTAKDFRTWGGTLLAAVAFAEHANRHRFPASATEEKRSVSAVMRRVAKQLEYAGGLQGLIRLARGCRSVSRRQNARGFPAASFAGGRRAPAGARPRGAGAPQPAPLVAHSAGARRRMISVDISASISIMARRTILVCDNCGKEVEEAKGAVMRITYSDARRGAKQADLCGECADKSPGQAAARRGRKPKSATAV
jgi:DNA topoisomerase I